MEAGLRHTDTHAAVETSYGCRNWRRGGAVRTAGSSGNPIWGDSYVVEKAKTASCERWLFSDAFLAGESEMARRLFLPVSAMAVAVCSGCASSSSREAWMSDAQVSVRFVVAPTGVAFTDASSDTSSPRLVADVLGGGLVDEPVWSSSGQPESNPYHVVLWGGAYGGADVTSAAVPLPTGPYTFGLFDQEAGAAYQGWINVNQPGDDLVSVMSSWQKAVDAQQRWLGYDQRIGGAFNDPDHGSFKTFQKQIRGLKNLERRIGKAIAAEKRAVENRNKALATFSESADVLLMPGAGDFFRPSTLPAFGTAELASIRDGQPLTKVVLLADYAATKEKVRRVNELRADLERSREVFIEEAKRIKRLQGYYAITNHLYHHNEKFVKCEARLQEVKGMISLADRQIKEHRQRCRALTFVAALFSPNDSSNAFDDDMRSLQRTRIVLEEHRQRFALKLAAVTPTNPKRAAVQRDLQQAIARIEAVDNELNDITDARVALGTLKDSTSIIHRYGATRVMTAAIMDQTVPEYLVDAIERESLMTVRLQATDSLYTPNKTVANGYSPNQTGGNGFTSIRTSSSGFTSTPTGSNGFTSTRTIPAGYTPTASASANESSTTTKPKDKSNTKTTTKTKTKTKKSWWGCR